MGPFLSPLRLNDWPDEEGIKTQFQSPTFLHHWDWTIELMKKGLRRREFVKSKFELADWTIDLMKKGLRLEHGNYVIFRPADWTIDLMKKGLRRLRPLGRHSLLDWTIDLMKKGLRPISKNSIRWRLRLNDWPDEEGIKTTSLSSFLSTWDWTIDLMKKGLRLFL